MGSYTQENRLIAVEPSPPLEKDELLLQGFTGHESISRLFSFHLDMLSENFSIDFNDIVGKSITVKVKLSDGASYRYFNGYVSRFGQSGSDLNFAHYRAEVVPWLWFLTRNANCRIFQNMKVPDIIQKIFSDRGFSDFRLSLQGSYDPLEYCVQYRETDFNFVSRLMEQNGIFYFFEHSDGKHVLVLGDKPSVHQPCPNQGTVRFDQMAGGGPEEDDVVTSWITEAELHTGKYSLSDYNFETPSTDLQVNEPTIISVDDNSRYEIYDYPGDYLNKGQGQTVAKVRMQEQEAQYVLSSGLSVCRVFTSGYKFNLEDYYRNDVNTSYVLTEVEHRASVGGSYIAGGSAGETYGNQFTCIHASVPFRPPRTTLKPFVQGPQTAKVVGKSGEEITVDQYGRVKVQFYWDREGKEDENSSCWIRVSQIIAGKNWGTIFIPRIGQEVIVDFLEGDPDRPIITGRVYNAEQMPPGALPSYQDISGIRTHSTKGGGEHDANVLSFCDTKGSEVLYMHAQKDRATRVENNDDLKVGNDQTQDIGHDRTTTIHHDKTLTVLNDRTSTIDGNDTETVMKNQDITVTQDQDVTVAQSQSTTIGMSQSNTIGTSQDNTIGTSQTNTIGATQSNSVGGSRSATVGGSDSQTVGGMLSITSGGVMNITVGGVTMITSGGPVMITAPVVLINGVLVVTQAVVSPMYSPGLGNLI
jgi:type VI secretion system secreted protein VgrG